MATTKAYEIGQLAGQLDVDSTGDITLTGNLDVSYSGFDSDFAAKTTTNLTEGDNLYYTTARADSDATVAAIAAISVTDAGGDGSLTYSNGAITYTGPSAAETRAHFSAGTGISINSGQISVNSSDNVTFADITTTGVINGPSTMYIDPAPVDSAGGLLVIRGDLQVDGTTTTVNSTTVTINDKNIVLADSAANASEADGAGITVEGANATITYDASNDEWDFNKDINVTGNVVVSGTVDGRDVATDGTKLDGVEAGATADQTASEILTAIKTVDGSGSGLDADTLDGVEGSSYLRSDANDTATGQYTFTDGSGPSVSGNLGGGAVYISNNGGSNVHSALQVNTVGGLGLAVQNSGNVGIGTNAPGGLLDVYTATNRYFRIKSSNADLELLSDNNTNPVLRIQGTGTADLVNIYDNTQEVFTILDGGNVGIGTTNPLERLHVYHSSTDTYDTIAHFQYYDTDDATMRYEAKLGPNGRTFFKSYVTGSETDFLIVDQDNAADRLSFQVQGNAGGIEGLAVTSTGKVGIGVTNPTHTLQVESTIAVPLKIKSTSTSGTGLYLDNDRSGSKTFGILSGNVAAGYFNIKDEDAGVNRFVISSAGDVGIGTTNPTHKLDVDGAIATRQVRHSIRPSLNLDFANSKTLDPRITYSRGSIGTYWDGYSTSKAEENLVRYSQAISTGNGFWNNGGMGTLTVNATTAPDGTTSASSWIPDTDAGSHYFYTNNLPAKADQEHTHSIYMKANGYNYGWLGSYDNIVGGYTYVVVNLTNGNIETTYTGVNASNVSASVTSVGNGWYRVQLTAILGYSYLSAGAVNTASNISNNVPNFTGNGTSGIYIWGAQSEWNRTSATSYTSTTNHTIVKYQPVLKTAGVNAARFDHDPTTGESKGLLIEESRTNRQFPSYLDSSWSNDTTMHHDNYSIAPDGTHTAGLIYESIGSRQQLVSKDCGNLVSGSTYIFSAFVKAYTWSGSVEIHAYGDGSTSFTISGADFEASDGSKGMYSVGNGWKRIWWKRTKSNTTGRFYIGFSGSTYAGDGYEKAFLAWGFQLELGAFPTSYIPTTSSSVTRSADSAQITDLQYENWHSNDEGTLYVDFGSTYIGQSIGHRVLNIVGSDGTVKYNLEGYRAEMRTTTSWSGINFSNETNAGGKIVMAYDNTGFDAASYGLGGYSAQSVVPYFYPDQTLNIGKLNTVYVNTTIKKVAYYPQRLSDDELTAMTEE